MSSPLDLELDFQDYRPANEAGQDRSVPDNTMPAPSGVQIKIPDHQKQQKQSSQSSGSRQQATASTSSGGGAGNLFQNLLNNASQSSGVSEESLRQIIWASNRFRQQQQQSKSAAQTNGGGGFNWGLNYFSQYFDIDTDDVLERIIWSAVPLRKIGPDVDNLADQEELLAPLATSTSSSLVSPTDSDDKTGSFSALRQKHYSYMERFIQGRPDLYGPFWVSTTLVFAIALFSNIVSFMQHEQKDAALNLLDTNSSSQHQSAGSILMAEEWHYNMDELNIMSSVIMLYTTLLPTFMWFLFWFRGCNKYYTLTETVCAYGYSLSIFIPLSLFLMVQATIFRYLMLTIATVLSGTVLTLSFLPVARSDPKPASSHIILAIIPLCHFALAYVIHRTMLQ